MPLKGKHKNETQSEEEFFVVDSPSEINGFAYIKGEST